MEDDITSDNEATRQGEFKVWRFAARSGNWSIFHNSVTRSERVAVKM